MSALWPVDSLRIWSGRFIDPLPGKPVRTPFGVRRFINNIRRTPIRAWTSPPTRRAGEGAERPAWSSSWTTSSIRASAWSSTTGRASIRCSSTFEGKGQSTARQCGRLVIALVVRPQVHGTISTGVCASRRGKDPLELIKLKLIERKYVKRFGRGFTG